MPVHEVVREIQGGVILPSRVWGKTCPGIAVETTRIWQTWAHVHVTQPMFVAAATDDQFGLAPEGVALYEKWTAAHKSAELDLYARGGHPNPTDVTSQWPH
jgi:hypothetical protein